MTSDDAPRPDLSISVDSTLSDAPEKVWRALTNPDLVAAWLAPNDLNAEVGERFTLRQGAPDKSDIACEVLRAEPHRLLQYRWRSDVDGRAVDSVVTFTLTEAKSGGTHLSVVHDDFVRLAHAQSGRRAAPVRAIARPPRLAARRVALSRIARPKILMAA